MSDLGPDDVPAVLQRGEQVLPQEEASLYRRVFPNGMLGALQGVGRDAMAGLDSLTGNYLADYADATSGRMQQQPFGAWRTLATLMPGPSGSLNYAQQYIPRGVDALIDLYNGSKMVEALPARMQYPAAKAMQVGRDASLAAIERGDPVLQGFEGAGWGDRMAPYRYNPRSGGVVDEQGREWFHDGGQVGGPSLTPVDYDPFADQGPAEDNLYQHHLTELAGGGVPQPGGGRSTIYQAPVEGPGGRYYNIPTVWGGQILTTPEARERAAAQGWDKWPSYATPDAADLAYEARVHPRAAADLPGYEDLHRPLPSAAEVRGRELAAPGRDRVDPFRMMLEPTSSDTLGSWAGDAAIGLAGGAAAGAALRWGVPAVREGLNSLPALLRDEAGSIRLPRGNAMLDRIAGLDADRAAEAAGEVRPSGAPRRSFSEIQAQDKGELAALEPRSRYDVLPEPIKVYHGSGAEFTRPDMGKVNTGEGHQTYGHGLYWGEARGTGEEYQREAGQRDYFRATERAKEVINNAITPGIGRFYDADEVRAIVSLDHHLAPLAKDDQAVRALQHLFSFSKPHKPGDAESAADVRAWGALDRSIRALHDRQGHLYEGELYVDPDRMLAWDRPLQEQSPYVRQRLEEEWLAHRVNAERSGQSIYMDTALTERQLRPEIADTKGMWGAAARRLHDAGLEGVKYLDQHSRYNPAVLPDNPIANEARQFLEAAKGDTTAALKAFLDSNPRERWADSERSEIRKVIEAGGRQVTHNFVTFSDQPVLLTSRNGERINETPWRLVPVDHEPEF